MVIQILACLENGLFVVVELVGAYAGAGLQHRRHVVVPARAHFQRVPVDGPTVISGVDVSGQAVFVAVQLVGAAKVHLARQRRTVAQVAQVMRVGGNVGGKVGRVVKTADF